MAKDLQHVWICTTDGQLIRADRIVSMRVRSRPKDNEVNEYGDDELLALLDNGDTVHLAWGGYGPAWQSMVHLAGAISLAADEAQAMEEAETGAAFVYPAGDDATRCDDEPTWRYCTKQFPFTAWPTGPQPRPRPGATDLSWLTELATQPEAASPSSE